MLHLDGISFRTLSDEFDISVGNVYGRVLEYLKSLPHCADVSRQYCSRYCGIMVIDGKYVRVRGYKKKIPVIYGLDYQTHDIPTYKLAPSESHRACVHYLGSLKLLNYPFKAMVTDENQNFFTACDFVYPKAVQQLCQNHYKQNIRKSLDLDANPKYISFMALIEDLFRFKRSPDDFNRTAKNIFTRYKQDTLCTAVMIDIYKQQDRLLAWRKSQGVPTTTNLIECFNSHLQDRLKTLQGFESFSHADVWLNAYFLRRRTKQFKSCEGKFKRLNGYNSLQKSKKPNVVLPLFFRQKRDRF